MAYTDKNINNLVLNRLSNEDYLKLQERGEINSDELYLTDSNESSLPDQQGQEGKYLTTNGTDASWKNINETYYNKEQTDELLQNESYAQRVIDTFTSTEGQTVYVASEEIGGKELLSVNVGNIELSSIAYTLADDKKTVTLGAPQSQDTIVDLKYFTKLKIGNSLNSTGKYDETREYIKNDFVTTEETDAYVGYVATANSVPAGTELTDTNYWNEMYRIPKATVAASFVEWSD